MKHLSRRINHLGDIAIKLRDLRGIATLVHELIQNAEDSGGATRISFDVSRDALIVDNDGVFADCGKVEDLDCSWSNEPARKRSCDFHRFRLIASEDKRKEPGAIGAFGIGFVSVYQITDHPELISAGRHWILHEDRAENERIDVCDGCEKCQAAGLPGTRFLLPWAFDSNSPMRSALNVDPVQESDLRQFFDQIQAVVPEATIFLLRLTCVEVRENGEPKVCFQRKPKDNKIIINDGSRDLLWHIYTGNFSNEAEQLRLLHAGRIEEQRSADVTLAIPAEAQTQGIFCAFLPTQQKSGLPFHINADFFTSSDRKRIVLESDYQTEWNRAAIKNATEVFRDSLAQLRDQIGHKRLWEILDSVHRTADEVSKGNGEQTLTLFWTCAVAILRAGSFIFTTRDGWTKPAEAFLLSEKDEEAAVPVLEAMGIPLVHPDLRFTFNILRSSDVNVHLLDIPQIAQTLSQFGLTKRVEFDALPTFLKNSSTRELLWKEIGILLRRSRKQEDQAIVESQIGRCAIAPGRDGGFWPCKEIYQAEEPTANLYSAIDSKIPFLACDSAASAIRSLCPNFSVSVAIERLTLMGRAELCRAAADGSFTVLELLSWFEDRREEILKNSALKRKMATLPIFPSSASLEPLTQLALPGDFIDPIGLTNLVDLEKTGGKCDFLRDMGARELSFRSYVTQYIPAAFKNPNVTPEKRRQVVRLLAKRLGEIRDDQVVRVDLSELPIIEARNGKFYRPNDIYLADHLIRDILGPDVPVAVIHEDGSGAIVELYRWLAVSEHPRSEDLVARVKSIVSTAPSPHTIGEIRNIVKYFRKRLVEDNLDREDFLELREIRWLPAKGDRNRWYRPSEIYTVFQDYLFESQGKFLDISRDIQMAGTAFLKFLGIKTEPEVSQVVAHLIKCSEIERPVNREVYTFLSNNSQDPQLSLLRSKACLLLPTNVYGRPDQVFWGEHPFGRFRHQLGPELRRYSDFWSRVGVKDFADWHDAYSLVLEMASCYGAANQPLDNEAYQVLLTCWRMLAEALEQSKIDAARLQELTDRKVIPNRAHILYPPQWMFFEDRAGIAAQFGNYLENNVIARPQGAWRAMTMAGLKFLSTVVKSHLLECGDPVEDSVVPKRLQARRPQLARLVDLDTSAIDLPVIDRLRCVSVQELKINFSVDLFKKHLCSDPVNVPAHFRRDENLLYFVRGGDSVPWAAVARELATALCPDVTSATLALGIKEVLAAQTDEDAERSLDELGFPPLQVSTGVAITVSEPVTGLGTENTPPTQEGGNYPRTSCRIGTTTVRTPESRASASKNPWPRHS